MKINQSEVVLSLSFTFLSFRKGKFFTFLSFSKESKSAIPVDHLCELLSHTWPLVFYKGDFSPFSLSFLEKNFLFSFLHSRSRKKIYFHFHKQKCKPMHTSAVENVFSVTFFLSAAAENAQLFCMSMEKTVF
jgi:hypothetical protein